MKESINTTGSIVDRVEALLTEEEADILELYDVVEELSMHSPMTDAFEDQADGKSTAEFRRNGRLNALIDLSLMLCKRLEEEAGGAQVDELTKDYIAQAINIYDTLKDHEERARKIPPNPHFIAPVNNTLNAAADDYRRQLKEKMA